ncbi:hypothetical protein [Cellulomonas phragmiteti]|uniref:DUF2975 domain-containing protein n=1 Tax=Cellulomonas phragmiteti TaxID=478780 RepID=A0ABQ4DQW2_9CELL|nr:hypothetical protein [Cellulomonas phragmiteti]GIG41746.1 hypothetical protein Cph01nite_35080 [Cellulomonas phragmiteti]
MIRLGPGGRRLAAALGPLLVVVGVVGVLVGVVNVVGATTASFGAVEVPVRIVSNDGVAVSVELRFENGPAEGLGVDGPPTGGLPNRDHRSHPQGILSLHVLDAGVVERVLSRADVLVRGVALLVAALALLPVLRRLAQGRALVAGDARRVAVVAGCVVLGAYVAPLVPWIATVSVLDRLPRTEGMFAQPPHHLEAFVAAALVLLVAALVRAVEAQDRTARGGSGRLTP